MRFSRIPGPGLCPSFSLKFSFGLALSLSFGFSLSLALSLNVGLSLSVGLLLSPSPALGAETTKAVDTKAMSSAYGQGQYQKAYQIGCLLLQHEPGNLAVHYLLGNCYIKLGHLDKATAEYKYCSQAAPQSQVGKYATTALDQIAAAHGNGKSDDESAEEALAEPPPPPLDKTDLETLEYKERLLKEGEGKIATNKAKLQKQIEAVNNRAEDEIQNLSSQIQSSPNRISALAAFGPAREALLNQAALRVRQLQEENEFEERKITAECQARVDKISSQKGNLTSQTRPGKSDLRLVQKGTGLFVRNYINFHGEPPPPPPPPELRATAKKLVPSAPKSNTKSHG